MVTLSRTTTSPIRPLGLALLGAVAALGVLVATSAVRSSWSAMLFFLMAGVVLAMLPVRLPGGAVSLLPAVLIPVWLNGGPIATSAIAAAAVLLSSAIHRVGLLRTVLSAAIVLAGVFAGHLLAFGVVAAGVLPESLPERAVLATLFAVGSWAGEVLIGWIATRDAVADAARPIPRASLIANLLLLPPAIILADVLVTRGVILFVLLLIILMVALGLIALYLSAETDRRGVAGERARLQSIVSQVPDGIFTVRPDLTVDWMNETATRLTGWDLEDAAGRTSADIIQARQQDGAVLDHRQAFLEAARNGQPVHTRAILRNRDGVERSVIISYTSMTSATAGLEIGVAAIREIPDDSRDSQIATLGHELRSPLTAILGYTGLMLQATPGSLDAEHQTEFIGRIAASSDYMLRLVNNLLDLRRIESGAEQLHPTLVDLDRVLQVVMALARLRATEKQLITRLAIEPDLPPICTDELLLRRTVDNLLSNAIKYTPPGGTVRLAAARRGDGVEISVSDTGIGLTDDEKARLFERFFRSTRPEARRERGTGLGLALVRESVRRLGGEISVTSRLGGGSTFTVWIPPLARTDEPSVAAAR